MSNRRKFLNLQNQRDKILDPFFFTVLLTGWFGYIFLAPIYVFESGLPQPADLLIFTVSSLGIGLYLLKARIVFDRVFATLGVMVALFAAINLSYSFYYGDSKFYYAILYYIFNMIAFGTTAIIFHDNPDRAFSIARIATIAALFLEITWIILFDSNAKHRETGSFNNPNQLGYWSILAAATLLVFNEKRKMPLLDLIAILLAGYLIMLSLSRAALAGYILIMGALMLSKSISVYAKSAAALLVCMVILLKALTLDPGEPLFQVPDFADKVTERLDLASQNDPEKFEERGYQRLWQYPEYLLFGSGEGAFWRFMDVVYAGRSEASGLEIHSGLATLLFSYGIFGFTLFCTFIYTIFQRAPILYWVTLVAVMSYGLTHQHIRFTGFWIYIGIVYGMTRYVLPKREAENIAEQRRNLP
jgi:hypothetical protein